MKKTQALAVWDCITDQGNVLFYVGTVGQVGENGVHVLDISDRYS